MTSFDRDYADSAIEELVHRRTAGQRLPSALVDDVARRLGRSRATILRWVQRGAVHSHAPRSRFSLEREHKVAVIEAGGSRIRAYRQLVAEGKLDCGIRTFERAVNRDMTARQRAQARGGARLARAYTLFLERQEEGRGVVAEADHKEIDVFVLPPRSTTPVKPSLTAFLDTRHRVALGGAVSLGPTQDEVLAGLGAAIDSRSDIGPGEGLPEILRIDRGLEFTANAITDAGAMLGIQIVHTPPYAPNRKGKVERFFRTLKDEFLSTLPYFADGPKRRDGSLDVPHGVAPLAYEVFVELFFDWLWHYNMERPHSALEAMTPAESWAADPTPIRYADPKKLRRHLLKRIGERKVSGRGVFVDKRWYTAAELEPLIGRKVEVRGLAHDRRKLQIFVGDDWIATVYPQNEASAAEKERLLARRAKAAREAAGLATSARARAKRRWGALTAKGTPEETTSVPKDAADELDRERGGNDAVLKRLGLDHRRGKPRRRRGDER